MVRTTSFHDVNMGSIPIKGILHKLKGFMIANLKIISIKDSNCMAHNGCRAKNNVKFKKIDKQKVIN
jgi:hypothetical protein